MILIVEQVYIFLYAVLAGAIAAFLYDLLRIKRRAIKTSVIIVGLEDILFWVSAAILLFLSVYKSNSGEMRGFIFIGNVLGVALYEAMLSRKIIKSSVMIINFVKKICMFIWKILSFPFILIYKIVKKFIVKPLIVISRLFKRFFLFIGRIVWKRLKKASVITNKAGVVVHKSKCLTKKKLKKLRNIKKNRAKASKTEG